MACRNVQPQVRTALSCLYTQVCLYNVVLGFESRWRCMFFTLVVLLLVKHIGLHEHIEACTFTHKVERGVRGWIIFFWGGGRAHIEWTKFEPSIYPYPPSLTLVMSIITQKIGENLIFFQV